jgi:ERCC4-type nuclease
MYGARVVPEARPAAVVIPRIAQAQTSVITRMDADEALLELVPNVLMTEASSCRAHFGTMRELVTSTPCYRLETGRDFDQLSVRFREMLES